MQDTQEFLAAHSAELTVRHAVQEEFMDCFVPCPDHRRDCLMCIGSLKVTVATYNEWCRVNDVPERRAA